MAFCTEWRGSKMSEPVDRFYGIIHNYVIHKYNGGVQKVPHEFAYIDERLAIVCDKLQSRFPGKIDNVVKTLFNNELSFYGFIDILDRLYGVAFELNYPRALGAIIACGVYVKKLSEIEENGEMPHFHQNSARFRNQINQTVLYMSKILDAQAAKQWNGENECTWEGFLEYITFNANSVENHNFVESRTSHPIILAATVGILGIIIYRYMF
uniref:Squalene synthase n=1 Tax=Panagrolaimus sp. ES5 TaxID=591445 RepID=A0AC34F7A3_9BILA